MANNQVSIPVEEKPRLVFQKDLEGGKKLYSFDWSPQYGLFNADPALIVLPAMTMQLFNPSSLTNCENIAVGDFLQVSVDPELPLYKEINPPKEYKLTEFYTNMFIVTRKEIDPGGYPIIIAELSL